MESGEGRKLTASAVESTASPKGEALFAPEEATLATEDAIYKGEGNANIVIALPREHKVIRLRKSLAGEISPDGGKARVQREVGFAANVISGFLGSYARIPEIVRYNVADLVKLSNAIRPLRPEKRRHKDVVETYATKFPDYTFLDSQLELNETVFRSRSTFCVEIKPKQGYVRKAEQKLRACPYCLTQYAKLRKRSISAHSNYCPFELFSGVEARVKAAVKELLRSPQNNLKIFKDGLVVYDQESTSRDLEGVLDEWFRNVAVRCNGERARVDEFCNLVHAALTRPFVQERRELITTSRPCNFLPPANRISTFYVEPSAIARVERCLRFAGKNCNFDGDQLPKDSVLERIWNTQRLSYVSTDYIYNIYFKLASLLDDDVIYSDLTKLDDTCSTISCILPGKCTNVAIQKTQVMKETHLQTLSKNITVKKYNDCFNEICGSNSEDISTNTNGMLVNDDFISQTEINLNLDSHRLLCGNKNLHNQQINDEDDERKANTLITAEHLLALQNYLLFTTARDCSILMTFRELHPENATQVSAANTIKHSERLHFLSSVRVSDLDPKSVHSIEKHQKRDIDILDSVISLLEKDILLENR